jgi:osmotically inducible protein OsmC
MSAPSRPWLVPAERLRKLLATAPRPDEDFSEDLQALRSTCTDITPSLVAPHEQELQMPDPIYTAKAHVTGGRAEGHGKTSDGALEVDLRLPTEMGGQGGGTNPEQLFAVGYAACFEGALGVVARRAKVEAGGVAIDSSVTLTPNGQGGFDLSVGLDVTLPGVEDAAQAVELVRGAHQVCPYSNATRGNIEVALTANGHAVE